MSGFRVVLDDENTRAGKHIGMLSSATNRDKLGLLGRH
jgi:hypothetical protein